MNLREDPVGEREGDEKDGQKTQGSCVLDQSWEIFQFSPFIIKTKALGDALTPAERPAQLMGRNLKMAKRNVKRISGNALAPSNSLS